MNEDDADIVRSVLAGNREDYRKLVDRYQLAAEQQAFRYARDLCKAEEIAQETLVEAYFRLDTLREPAHFRNWLYAIVRNAAASWFRRQQRVVSLEQMNVIDTENQFCEHYHYHEKPTPQEALEQREQQQLLQAAIRELPPRHQRVITLFYFEEYSCQQIAACLDTSVSSVKSLLHRARQQLKKEMLKHD